MKHFFLRFKVDLSYLILLTLLCLAITGYLLRGAYWDTGYQDWIYHAFRTESLHLHGFTSWDHVWNNGMSYWQAYQFVPHYLTLAFSLVSGLPIPKAMMTLGVIIFILFRVFLYIGARSLRCSPLTSFLIALISLSFIGYWNELRDYGIIYGCSLVPLALALWYRTFSDARARLVFAAVVGLMCYVHPLSAVTLGGLWFCSLPFSRPTFKLSQFGIEAAIIASLGFMYAYNLFFNGSPQPDPYSLTPTFIRLVGAGNSQLGPILYAVLALTWLAFLFKRELLSPASRLLLTYSTILLILIQLNLNTPYLNFINKYQIVRAAFFVVVGLLLPAAQVLDRILAKGRAGSPYGSAILAFACSLILAQAFTNTSYYGPSTATNLADPVKDYFALHPEKPTGSIYIADSIISSYDRPDLRFSNGYNDSLLPQLVNIRLRLLLSAPTNDYAVSEQQISLINAYCKVLGIQYIFLPSNSPYSAALIQQDQAPYQLSEHLHTTGYDEDILKLPWAPSYATAVQATETDLILHQSVTLGPTSSPSEWTAYDKAILALAAIKSEPGNQALAVDLSNLERVSITLPSDAPTTEVYINESYSKGWRSSAGTIQRTAEGMILVTIPPGTNSPLLLTHSWGKLLLVQGVLAGLALLSILIEVIRITLTRRNKP